MIFMPILVVLFVVGFLTYVKIETKLCNAQMRRGSEIASKKPPMSPEQSEYWHQYILAMNRARDQRMAYTEAALSGQLPPLPQSGFQRVGTALFMGELAYGSAKLLSGHHGHRPNPHLSPYLSAPAPGQALAQPAPQAPASFSPPPEHYSKHASALDPHGFRKYPGGIQYDGPFQFRNWWGEGRQGY